LLKCRIKFPYLIKFDAIIEPKRVSWYPTPDEHDEHASVRNEPTDEL